MSKISEFLFGKKEQWLKVKEEMENIKDLTNKEKWVLLGHFLFYMFLALFFMYLINYIQINAQFCDISAVKCEKSMEITGKPYSYYIENPPKNYGKTNYLCCKWDINRFFKNIGDKIRG